jgi:hypothetical protein
MLTLAARRPACPLDHSQSILRVAKSHYDPLGLLSMYMTKWKLLTRRVTMSATSRNCEDPLGDKEVEEFKALLRDIYV